MWTFLAERARVAALASSLAVLLALALPAAAQALPVYVDNGSGSADFTVPDSYGCDDSGTCPDLEIKVLDARNHELWDQWGSTTDAGESLGNGSFRYQWACAHTGRLTWRATTDAPAETTTGVIHVPRCKPTRWRQVSYSTAADYATQFTPDGELVDQVGCDKYAAVRRSTAGEWLCRVTSNTVYRACTRSYLLAFVWQASGRGFGPYKPRWSATTPAATRCKAI